MKHSSHEPRYHPTRNPPYQINYRAKRSGKHITCSKRRITFKFGFSNADAIASGRLEAECRGEEHEVVLIWSHVTGKRQIFMDGREIHMSKAAMGNTKFTHTWGIAGNHVMKIVANAAPPMGEQAKMNPDVRQFDLLLDGMSYFDFSHIYQLGYKSEKEDQLATLRSTSLMIPSTTRVQYEDDKRNDSEEENIIDHYSSGLSIDLLDNSFSSGDVFSSKLTAPSISDISQYSRMPSLVPSYSSSYDEFSPVNSSTGVEPKSFDVISNEILTTFSKSQSNFVNPSKSTLEGTAFNSTYQDPPQFSLALVPTNDSSAFPNVADVGYSQRSAVSMYNYAKEEEGPVDDITKSMANLVNLDDLSKPSQHLSKSSTSSMQAQKTINSHSLQWAIAGRAPTLSEIQNSMKDVSSTQSSERVMRNLQQNQFAAPNSLNINQPSQHFGFNKISPSVYSGAY